MNNGTQVRADRRVLISAALLGSGVGLALGAAYMAGGMSRAATDHARAERVAQTAGGAFSEAVLQREAADPAVLALARAHDPAAADGPDHQLQLLAQRLRGEQTSPDESDDRRQAARDLDCLTDAVYFEARGETRRGQQAVATVVLNRVKNPKFPKTVCGVVFQRASGGCQFSFACDGSMRRRRELDAWEEARRVASRALAGFVLRDVGSATHFHTVDVAPEWGPQMLKVAQVGLHVFYRRNPHAPVAPQPEPQPETAVFTSSPAQPSPTLRIATALVQKPAEPPPLIAPPPAAKPAPAKPAPAPAAKPPEAASAGLTRTAAPDAPAPAATAAL